MTGPVAATIVAKPYLSHARVLAHSFREHHPEIPFFALLADDAEGRLDPADEPYELLAFDDLGLDDADGYRFRYEQQPLSYAMTPHLIDHLLGRGFDRVVFIKQESLVLDRLDPVLAALETASVVLTPHMLEPSTAVRELTILLSGVFNGGIVGVGATADGRAFLRWWADRVRYHCVHDVASGLHYEQRWLDLAPGRFGGVHVLRDPSVNVGHWNLGERRVRIRDGRVLVGDEPCRLFRFSGYSPAAPEQMTAYLPDLKLADAGEAAAVFERFGAELAAAGWAESARWPYAYDRFVDGVPIPPIARAIHRELGPEAARFGDPFHRDAPGGFAAWLGEPVDGTPITRLWRAVVERRDDLKAVFPDPFGADRDDFLRWTAQSGAREHLVSPVLWSGGVR
ncbi:MAG: hypothetical protein QOJ46_709 [bacterium]